MAGYRTWSRLIFPPTYSPNLITVGWKHVEWKSGNFNFGQFKGHYSGVPGDLAGYRTWSRYYAQQHIHQVW